MGNPPKNWELHDGKYGGRIGPDPQDSRDFLVANNARKLALPFTLPAAVDNLHFFRPELYDQGQLGSCVAWGFRRGMEFVTKKAGHGDQPLSALGAYKVAQEVAGWPIAEDTGLYLRDMVRAVRGRGYGREEDWPYDLSKAFQRPGSEYYLRALNYRNRIFYRVESVLEMKAVLAAGHPVVIGVMIAYNFWEAEGNGNVKMPVGPWAGGHCWAVGGYKDASGWEGGGYFEGPNSWADWTPRGLLRIPYAYMDRADGFPDAWTLAWREAEQPPEM